MDEKPSSATPNERVSLLDIIDKRNKTTNKKTILHRMIIVSKFTYPEPKEVAKYYENLIKDVQARQQTELVTGLFLVFHKHSVHILESSSDVLVEVVRQLHSKQLNSNSYQEQSKILIVSHDIPQRLYFQWTFHFVDIEAPRDDEYDTSETPDKLQADLLKQLLKLSQLMSRQSKVNFKSTLSTLHEKHRDLLPQLGSLSYLVDCKHNCMRSLSDLLANYDQPFDVSMPEDHVWPMPVRLFPYN